MKTEIYKLPSGLKFKLRLEGRSGDEAYIVRQHKTGEDYVPKNFKLNESSAVIDIGAHIGRFTVYAASLARNGQIYSFEPHPENFALLKDNVELNHFQNVNLFQAAVVGKEAGRIKLYEHKSASEHSVLTKKIEKLDKFTEVETTTLPKIIDDNQINECGLVKMDCEGAEYEILIGLPADYMYRISQFVLEFHDDLQDQYTFRDLLNFFSRHKYSVRARMGAFYTGLLFAKKSYHLSKLPTFFSYIVNYLRLYLFDYPGFIVSLIKKRLWKSK